MEQKTESYFVTIPEHFWRFFMWLLVKKYVIIVWFIFGFNWIVGCEMKQNTISEVEPNSVPLFQSISNSQENRESEKSTLESQNNESAFTVSPSSLALKAEIGQMLIVGFRGAFISDKGVLEIVRDIKKYHLGGVIFFDYDIALKSNQRNIRSPQQVKSLTQWLQAASPITPLFITIDEEGGKIHRLKEKFGFQLFTQSAQYLGKNTPFLTYEHASQVAETLAELGINFNFAPVVDLNLNPNNPVIGKLGRSFSRQPAIVTQHALAFIKAHHESGILCAIKHFPGHGSSTDDSHLGFVDVTQTWKPIELEPYQQIIKQHQADAIMTAHVFHEKLDKQYPATLSKKIVSNLLRNKLDYQGVIISDDMQMKAITKHYSFPEAIQATLQAGVDMIIIGNNLEYDANIVKKTVNLINGLIQEGKLNQQQIQHSLQRIQELKQQLPLSYYRNPNNKSIITEQKKEGSSCQKETSRLILQITPEESHIRLMNIKPSYQKGGICLKPGWYAISVTHPDYWGGKHWVEITKHSDVFVDITLKLISDY